MEKFLVDLLMTVAPLKDSLLEENQELHLSKEYFQLHSPWKADITKGRLAKTIQTLVGVALSSFSPFPRAPANCHNSPVLGALLFVLRS